MTASRSKYKAKPTVVQGRRYASYAEAMRGLELRLLEQSGAIAGLEYQPTVVLVPGVRYRPDFKYLEGGRWMHEDVKGVETPAWKIKAKLWALVGPGPLRITRRMGDRIGQDRVIESQGFRLLPPSRA